MSIYRRCDEVVGYVYEGEIYCPDCFDDDDEDDPETSPVFLDSEAGVHGCTNCGDLIDCSYTDEDVEYALSMLREFNSRRYGSCEFLDQLFLKLSSMFIRGWKRQLALARYEKIRTKENWHVPNR